MHKPDGNRSTMMVAVIKERVMTLQGMMNSHTHKTAMVKTNSGVKKLLEQGRLSTLRQQGRLKSLPA